MTDEMLARLQALDPEILSDVVRQDQDSPSFQITEWSVTLLSDKGAANPDGLWLFSGAGNDSEGTRPWSVVLKILQRPDQEQPSWDMFYWKREMLLTHSSLVENLPGSIRAPRFFRTDDIPEGGWLWMEHIKDRHSGPWGLEDYAFAARQLGVWNGKYVTGTALPDEPWLGRQLYRSWLSDVNPENDWQLFLHQKHISNDIRLRWDRLWAEREMFFRVSETLPQVFSHFDSQRRNLFISKGKNKEDELVLVDWSCCGLGPLGAELNSLVGSSAMFLEWPSSFMAQLDSAAFEEYLKGLGEAGWRGDKDIVRLGFVAWQALIWGMRLPGVITGLCATESRAIALQLLGQAEEELYLEWLPLLLYFLDCADEARLLMKKLKLK